MGLIEVRQDDKTTKDTGSLTWPKFSCLAIVPRSTRDEQCERTPMTQRKKGLKSSRGSFH
eukprot:1187408-Prorocentrum_minimum.AAC.4